MDTGELRVWAIVAVAALIGAAVGFTTSSLAWMALSNVPSTQSAIHAPVLEDGDDQAVALELERARHSLEMNQNLIATMQTDPRWAAPAQRAGMTYAMESTMAIIAEQEARIRALEAKLAGER